LQTDFSDDDDLLLNVGEQKEELQENIETETKKVIYINDKDWNKIDNKKEIDEDISDME